MFRGNQTSKLFNLFITNRGARITVEELIGTSLQVGLDSTAVLISYGFFRGFANGRCTKYPAPKAIAMGLLLGLFYVHTICSYPLMSICMYLPLQALKGTGSGTGFPSIRKD